MNVEGRITQFTEYFREQIEVLVKLSLAGDADVQIRPYRKTLWATLIDCLAGIRFDSKNYPELGKQNRQRFMRFVEEYGNWPHRSRISVPFLVS
jgi:hypothetical protein